MARSSVHIEVNQNIAEPCQSTALANVGRTGSSIVAMWGGGSLALMSRDLLAPPTGTVVINLLFRLAL